MTEFGDRQRFFEALARAVLAVPPPLLLLLDDLQWCDRETIEWLHYLSGSMPGRACSWSRPRDRSSSPTTHPLRTMLRHLRGAGPAHRDRPEPLDAAETAGLAAHFERHALDDAAAPRLYRETEGNPLFVVETARAGPARRGARAARSSRGSGSRPARTR